MARMNACPDTNRTCTTAFRVPRTCRRARYPTLPWAGRPSDRARAPRHLPGWEPYLEGATASAIVPVRETPSRGVQDRGEDDAELRDLVDRGAGESSDTSLAGVLRRQGLFLRGEHVLESHCRSYGCATRSG